MTTTLVVCDDQEKRHAYLCDKYADTADFAFFSSNPPEAARVVLKKGGCGFVLNTRADAHKMYDDVASGKGLVLETLEGVERLLKICTKCQRPETTVIVDCCTQSEFSKDDDWQQFKTFLNSVPLFGAVLYAKHRNLHLIIGVPQQTNFVPPPVSKNVNKTVLV